MIGSVNKGVQQQIPVLKELKPGVTEQQQTTQNPVQQEQTRPLGTSTAQVQPTETRNLGATQEELNGKIIQTGRDNSLLTRSDARGNNLDITV